MTKPYRMLAAVVFLLALAACSKSLPEPDSAAAKLYVDRCGGCHQVFHPGSMTSAMWKYQVARAQKSFMRPVGRSLTATEYNQILDYLVRNAGKS